MSSRFDLIAQLLLHKSFSDCTVSELQLFTEQYPYSAPAQFLLAKKMLAEDAPGARAQVQKAALYYHQPAAFDAFLQADFPDTESFYRDEENAAEVEGTEDEFLPLKIDLPAPEAVAPTNAITEEQPPIVAEPPHQTFSETNHPAQAETIEATPVQPIEQPFTPAAEEQALTPPLTVSEEQKPKAELPAFEPYHTIDYFASQGIRLSKEEATKDKMGKQLKSFTEWLKTMKRLPATEQIKDLDPHAEKKVENLAAHSVEETEIVTEAMAEVWLKQGNLEKAAEVYNKLSLSNPTKRAYFAAKLESLK